MTLKVILAIHRANKTKALALKQVERANKAVRLAATLQTKADLASGELIGLLEQYKPREASKMPMPPVVI